jgi:hypothetical protein
MLQGVEENAHGTTAKVLAAKQLADNPPRTG